MNNLLTVINKQASVYLIVFILFASYVRATEVVIATGINHDPPYVYGSKKISADFPGVTIDVLRLIETKIGIKFIIKKYPWKRVIHEVKNDRIDGGFHFSFKEERRSFVAYPIPEGALLPNPNYSISNRSYVIYRFKGQSIRWNGSQIVLNPNGENTIGAIRGCSIINDIKKLGHELHEVATDEQLLKLLLLKRIHAFIALENMIDPKIKTLDRKERILIEKSLPAVANKPYYIAFSKKFYRKNQKTAWKIWKIINRIKKSGELQKIFARYIDR